MQTQTLTLYGCMGKRHCIGANDSSLVSEVQKRRRVNGNEERVGRPSLVDHDVLLRAVEEYRRQPLRKDAKKMGVPHTVVAAYLELLEIVKKLDKWVPHDFTEQQQLKRFEVSSSLLIRNDAEPFLHCIVTCDEKWILYDNRERSAQWVGVYEPPKKSNTKFIRHEDNDPSLNHGLNHYAFILQDKPSPHSHIVIKFTRSNKTGANAASTSQSPWSTASYTTMRNRMCHELSSRS
uniref:Histone-lysine N-methyltransferase SETMAR n=1 Tax=Haemonchus contortus TaxID=6289 RepID=A0A7I4YDJ6_HAECO